MQRNSRNNPLAIVLIVIGAIMLLGILPKLIGGIFAILFPLLFVALGYYGIKRGHKFIGWIVLIIGLISVIGKLAWLIGPLLGIALVVWGISVLKGKGNRTY
ncbi:hypothetical protein [Paenibacillus sp. NFR01]|uniref:hypothetical protein n=1 Tax=Paenibacillus sp. NFR01 TaxID=1566279 RepID=UPI0008B5AE62|nr:hypothetical protein [Paenibacillus sp. NFR01]SEU20800.1 hypothetical protein SAMN03159358_4023 [Paenibacillus sp. NFR01]